MRSIIFGVILLLSTSVGSYAYGSDAFKFFSDSKSIEKYLRTNDFQSAKGEIRQMYSSHSIDADELTSWLDLIDINLLQNIAAFNKNYQKYITGKDDRYYREAVKSYNGIAEASTHEAILSNIQKYCSSDFLTYLNNEIDATKKQMSEITDIFKTETARKQQVATNEAFEKEKRKILEESMAKDAERKKEKYKVAYSQALEVAKSSVEYKELELRTDICCAIEDKKVLEKRLGSDMEYAKRYGVIDVNSRGAAVEQIKNDDITIVEGKKEYRKVVGNSFNSTKCKQVNCGLGSTQLSEFANTLALKSMERAKDE